MQHLQKLPASSAVASAPHEVFPTGCLSPEGCGGGMAFQLMNGTAMDLMLTLKKRRLKHLPELQLFHFCSIHLPNQTWQTILRCDYCLLYVWSSVWPFQKSQTDNVLPDCYPPPFWSDWPPAVSWWRLPAVRAGFSLPVPPPAGQWGRPPEQSAPWSQPPMSQYAPETLQGQRLPSKHSTHNLIHILYLWYSHWSQKKSQSSTNGIHIWDLTYISHFHSLLWRWQIKTYVLTSGDHEDLVPPVSDLRVCCCPAGPAPKWPAGCRFCSVLFWAPRRPLPISSVTPDHSPNGWPDNKIDQHESNNRGQQRFTTKIPTWQHWFTRQYHCM